MILPHQSFCSGQTVIGMVHLLPLPGAPGYDGDVERVLERAVSDARTLADGGVDGVLVENYGDVPFFPSGVPAETVAAMTAAAKEIARNVSLPLGLNVLRNDAGAALAIAVAVGARFIRVNVHTGVMETDQGLIEGRAHDTLRLRHRLGADNSEKYIEILADVHVKHGRPLREQAIAGAARDTFERGRADGLIVTGPATGSPCDLEDVRRIREHLPQARVFVGSGVTSDNVRSCLAVAQGVIVGTSIKIDTRVTNPVDPVRVQRLVEAAKGIR